MTLRKIQEIPLKMIDFDVEDIELRGQATSEIVQIKIWFSRTVEP